MNMMNPALQRFGDVTVRLSVELGRSDMPLKSVLALAEGSVVPLDRATDELLTLTANGRVIARGEVVAQDGRFALRIVTLEGEDVAAAPVAPSATPASPAPVDAAALPVGPEGDPA